MQPLVGSEAPDFIGEAVFDQEFQTISLSQFRVRQLPGGQCYHEDQPSCDMAEINELCRANMSF